MTTFTPNNLLLWNTHHTWNLMERARADASLIHDYGLGSNSWSGDPLSQIGSDLITGIGFGADIRKISDDGTDLGVFIATPGSDVTGGSFIGMNADSMERVVLSWHESGFGGTVTVKRYKADGTIDVTFTGLSTDPGDGSGSGTPKCADISPDGQYLYIMDSGTHEVSGVGHQYVWCYDLNNSATRTKLVDFTITDESASHSPFDTAYPWDHFWYGWMRVNPANGHIFVEGWNDVTGLDGFGNVTDRYDGTMYEYDASGGSVATTTLNNGYVQTSGGAFAYAHPDPYEGDWSGLAFDSNGGNLWFWTSQNFDEGGPSSRTDILLNRMASKPAGAPSTIATNLIDSTHVSPLWIYADDTHPGLARSFGFVIG